MYVILALLAMLAVLIGLISVIYPLRFLKIRSRKQAVLLLVVGIIVFVLAANRLPPSTKTDAPATVADAGSSQVAQSAAGTIQQPSNAPIAAVPAPKPPTPQEKASSLMPDGQRRFLAIIEEAKAQYASGRNEMAKGAARPARANALCQAFKSPRIDGWVGKVTNLSTNSDGKGVLSIEISDDVKIGTWNNALSDIGDKTLLDPSGSVFRKASVLEKGQWVRFSGTFVRGDTDCFNEQSVTLRGSITDPEFVLRFSDIAALD